MSCQKIPYETKKDAIEDARLIKVQHKFRSRSNGKSSKCDKKQYAHKCYFCNKWHLSTQKRRK